MFNAPSRRRTAVSFDCRLETLEGRSLLSATVAPPAAESATASTSDHQVLVADEAFLSAGSDQSRSTPASSCANDSDMYDFGGAWGSRAPAAATQASGQSVSLDDGAVDQTGDRPAWTITPADVISLAPPTWAAPAEYTPMPAQFGPQADAPATPSIAVSAPAPVVNAPETPADRPADQTPVVIATGGASPADTTFIWIENSDSWLLTTKAKAAEQVVIESTFVGR